MKEIKSRQGHIFQVDDDDFEEMSKISWTSSPSPKNKNIAYAISRVGRKTVSMHRTIMKPPKKMMVDHIDGNPLNNQKSNLRICSNRENQYNSKNNILSGSKYKGVYKVYWKRKNGAITTTWKAQIVGFKYSKTFKTEIEAAIAYNEKALECYGEYAYLNKL